MKNFLLVFFGGGLGSVLRWYAGTLVGKAAAGGFPAGTFVVNIVGCLVFGLCLGYFADGFQKARLLLMTGLCGGFTTFSALSGEAFTLLRDGNAGMCAFYISASILCGLVAVALGFWGSRIS